MSKGCPERLRNLPKVTQLVNERSSFFLGCVNRNRIGPWLWGKWTDRRERDRGGRKWERRDRVRNKWLVNPYKIWHGVSFIWGFPGGSDDKESACNGEDSGSIPGFGRSLGEGNGNPLQYSYLAELHGQRSLAGYNPWGHKELEMTERLTLSLSFQLHLLQSDPTIFIPFGISS